VATRVDRLVGLAAGMIQPWMIGLAMARGHRRIFARRRLRRPVVVAFVGHRHCEVVVVVVDDELGVGLFIDELSDDVVLPDGDELDETEPLDDIEAEVDVSVDGVVVVVVVVLELGEDVSVDAVVVDGVEATVVEDPGVALAPELL
jgi:hypothetical protein